MACVRFFAMVVVCLVVDFSPVSALVLRSPHICVDQHRSTFLSKSTDSQPNRGWVAALRTAPTSAIGNNDNDDASTRQVRAQQLKNRILQASAPSGWAAAGGVGTQTQLQLDRYISELERLSQPSHKIRMSSDVLQDS
jgi:hypothetical protein